MAIFEHSHPPFWCKTHSPSLFRYVNLSPPPSPFYDHHTIFMTGPTRTQSTSSSSRDKPVNPPRPPNAWILYRSDTLKNLPEPEPGQPRKPQADISKMISAMWRLEPQEVRARYERLSDIKKAEHQELYPGYRFQPMKKADKDRIRAEKQAEKERVRNSRKQKARTRGAIAPNAQPLYTTEARLGPAGPSPPVSGPSTPHTSLGSGQSQHTVQSQPTPPANHLTPPCDPGAPTSSAYPPAPASSSFPPLVAPQPGAPQRPPSASDWQPQTQQQNQNQQMNSLWLHTDSQLQLTEPTNPQEYLTVPLPNHSSQQPLGWSPDDPAPFNESTFFPDSQDNQPLQAVLSATDDPHVFQMNGFNFEELFNGTRDIEVSMGSNTYPPFDPSSFSMLESMLGPWTSQSEYQLDQNAIASSSHSFLDGSYNSLPSPSLGGVDFNTYSLENYFDDSQPGQYEGEVVSPEQAQTPTPQDENKEEEVSRPYVPPTGAGNSARRVGADWRHTIQVTPEREVGREVVWSTSA